MANDIDIKIGIRTEGDTSGAEAVDKAIAEIKTSAEAAAKAAGNAASESAQAAGTAAERAAAEVQKLRDEINKKADSGGVTDAIGDLDKATDSLADGKKRAAVNGFSKALEGLAKGDIAGGMRGVATSLFSLADAIPIPGAAIAFSLALTGVAAAWKAFGPEADDARKSVNEFGLTLDEEMQRLEAWANAEIEWGNIKEANESLRKDFDLVTSTAKSTQKAIEAMFSARIQSETSGLRGDADKAEASGDVERAADLRAKAVQLEQYEELVNVNVALRTNQFEYDELSLKTRMLQENFDRTKEEAEATANRLGELKTKLEEQGNSTWDQLVAEKDTRVKLAEQLTKEIAERERLMAKLEVIESQRHWTEKDTPYPDDKGFVGMRGTVGDIKQDFADIPSLKILIQDLNILEEIVRDSAEKEAELVKQREESNAAATKMAQEMVAAKVQIETLEIKLKDLANAAGPEQAAKAADHAQLMTSQMADAMEAMHELTIENAEQVIAVATAAATGAVAVSSDLATAKTAYEESAKQMGEATGKIKIAAENIGEEATDAGNEIKAGAEDFRTKIGEAGKTWKNAAADLVENSRATLDLVQGLSNDVAQMRQQVAAAQHAAAVASADAGLALSQIRNT